MPKHLRKPTKSILAALLISTLAQTAIAQEPRDRTVSYDQVVAEYTVGVFKLESGEVLEAVDHLEYAWRMSGHEIAIGMRLAQGYYMLKNFTRCEMVIDEVLISDPSHLEALLTKGKVRYIRRDPEGAVATLEQIREYHSTVFEAERLLGNIYYEMGRNEQAMVAYEKCIAIDPSYPFIFLRYGRILAQEKRYEEAEAAFLGAMGIDPGFTDPAMELGELYLEQGRTDEALAVLERIVLNDTSNSEALLRLSRLYFETARYEDGIALLEARREKGSLGREAEIMRGRFYYESGKFDEAFVIFEDLFNLEQNNAELARVLGEISLKRSDADAARKYFDFAIAIEPKEYRNYLGLFFASTPEFSSSETIIVMSDEEREGVLDDAARRIPRYDFDGNYMVGIAYLSLDALDKAEHHLLAAREMNDKDRATLLNLANLHEKRKEYEQAEVVLKSLFEMFPEDATICNFYGYVLAELGRNLEFAEELVRRALAQDTDNGYYLDSLGWILYQQGDYSRAVIELEKANSVVQNDPVILEHLGDAYAAMKRFNEARAAYEESSKLQGGSIEIMEKIESTVGDPE